MKLNFFIELIFIIFLLLAFQFVEEDIITVCNSNCDYQKIQEAIDNSLQGETIIVKEGVYSENIKIQKENLEIIGENATLIPKNSDLPVIEIKGKKIKLERFSIENSEGKWENAIYIFESSELTIRNCSFFEFPFSIVLDSSSNNILENNKIILEKSIFKKFMEFI